MLQREDIEQIMEIFHSSQNIEASFDFKDIKPKERTSPVFAIDGGSGCVVGNRGLAVVAARACALPFFTDATPILSGTRTKIMNSKDVPDFAKATDEFRNSIEIEVFLKVVESGFSGIILTDGILPPTAGHSNSRVLSVAKDSKVMYGDLPLLYAVEQAAGRSGPWMSTVDKRNIVCFSSISNDAYFVDGDIDDALPEILPLCYDPYALGYPYPLERAHRESHMSPKDMAAIGIQIEQKMIEEGMSPDLIEQIFKNRHGVVDQFKNGGAR